MHFCVYVYVSLQTFADVVVMGSSVPQLLEDQKGEPGLGSPVSNPISANPATNPVSVSPTADLQVCVAFSHGLCQCLLLFLLMYSMSDTQKIVIL